MPKPGKKITALYAKHLSEAVAAGYGQKISDIDYETPDGNMIAHLVKNVYSFSAAKNYTQLRQLTQALIGEDHKLRTKSQFKRAAFEITDTHVNQWLEAEYELAVAGSQMASKWVDITNNPASKIIEFDVVLDSKTSNICRPLHGLRVKVDDPILSIYYPPNHFRCRTTVRQHLDGSVTPAHKRELPEIPEMFRVNLAKQKMVFPPGHAYWIGTPASVIQEALSMAPLDTWIPVEEKTVRIHSRVDTTEKGFNDVMEVARDFAAKGSKVDLLPTIDTANDPLYKKLFSGAKPGKCPDLFIDKKFVEVKRVSKDSFNTIKHSISQASTQADHVVILLPGMQDYKTLKRIIKGRFKDHKKLKVIEFKMGDAYYTFHRENWIK